MTAKPRLKPEQLTPTSGRSRMTIDYPVEVAREPDEAEPPATPARPRGARLGPS